MRLPYRKPGKYSQITKDPHITQQKYDQLAQDLERLRAKHPGAAAEVHRLAQMGDFSENAAYQMAKGRLRGINNAIMKIEHQMKNAIIIERDEHNTTVQIGDTVTIESADKTRTYTILGSTESDPANGIISHISPIGSALLGSAVGNTVIIGPQKTEYTITKIGQ